MADIVVRIDEDLCAGCGICAETCEDGALEMNEDGTLPVWNADNCTACEKCAEACPSEAITIEK